MPGQGRCMQRCVTAWHSTASYMSLLVTTQPGDRACQAGVQISAHLSQRQLCLPDGRQGFGLHEPHWLGLQAVLPCRAKPCRGEKGKPHSSSLSCCIRTQQRQDAATECIITTSSSASLAAAAAAIMLSAPHKQHLEVTLGNHSHAQRCTIAARAGGGHAWGRMPEQHDRCAADCLCPNHSLQPACCGLEWPCHAPLTCRGSGTSLPPPA